MFRCLVCLLYFFIMYLFRVFIINFFGTLYCIFIMSIARYQLIFISVIINIISCFFYLFMYHVFIMLLNMFVVLKLKFHFNL